jgi:hypothetical protein
MIPSDARFVKSLKGKEHEGTKNMKRATATDSDGARRRDPCARLHHKSVAVAVLHALRVFMLFPFRL